MMRPVTMITPRDCSRKPIGADSQKKNAPAVEDRGAKVQPQDTTARLSAKPVAFPIRKRYPQENHKVSQAILESAIVAALRATIAFSEAGDDARARRAHQAWMVLRSLRTAETVAAAVERRLHGANS